MRVKRTLSSSFFVNLKKIMKPIPFDDKQHLIPAHAIYCEPQTGIKPFGVWLGWGTVIRQIRNWVGIDQELFGRLIRGYTRSQIGRYEKEAAEPPIDFWIKMMRTFGLSINWALTGKGVPYVIEYIDSEEYERFLKWSSIMDTKKELFEDPTEEA